MHELVAVHVPFALEAQSQLRDVRHDVVQVTARTRHSKKREDCSEGVKERQRDRETERQRSESERK